MSEAVSQEILHTFITQVSHEAWSWKINEV